MNSLPSKFNKLQVVVLALIIAKGVANWGMTLLEVNAIVAYQTTWTPLWAASVNKMTKNQTSTTNRDANQLLYQPALALVFDNHLLNNAAISAADKKAMGIHEVISSHTPVPDPTEAPIVKISYGAPLILIVNMINAATGRIGKPKGVGFMEMWYKIDDPAPMGLGDMNLKVNINKSGSPITFLLSQKGKTVYFFARWVAKKGTYGPWGAYFSAVIA